MSSAKNTPKGKETVYLVQAKPKYNFQNARKLPKEHYINVETNKTNKLSESAKLEISHSLASNELSSSSRPVAIVEASRSKLLKCDIKTTNSSGSMDAQCLVPSQPGHLPSLPVTSVQKTNLTVSLPLSPNTSQLQTVSRVEFGATGSVDLSSPATDERIKHLEHEKDKLQTELTVQLQVNRELKKLLVASIGEDLFQRVDRLCQDRAQLSVDIGGFSKKLCEDNENLDKVSIQADMWRSKYLASRVMIEELGNARAYYALQCHDTQDSLQELLNERHELRTNLLEAYKVLQQVKSAFDPLNSQYSSSLRSTDVLELSRACQQLSEAMRFRLLPAHVAVHIEAEDNWDIWTNCVTRAEQFAHEILSRPSEPAGSLQSGSTKLLPLTGPKDQLIKRFHPDTRHENLTLNCCDKCKGEITVI